MLSWPNREQTSLCQQEYWTRGIVEDYFHRHPIQMNDEEIFHRWQKL